MIEKLLVQPGEKVPVGRVMAIIREEGQPAAADVAKEITPPRPLPAAPKPGPVVPALPEAEAPRLKISPVARKLAEELGIDPSTIKGSGPGGRITREDVEKASKEKQAVPLDRFARMRQTIAAVMARAKREIPHYYLSTTIDMNRAMTWLAEVNA